MPAPAVYIVVAVVSAAAAGFAFKEFVYDPHLAPKIDEWSERFAAYRREKFKKRAPAYSSMPSSDGGNLDNVRADVELENMKAHSFSDGSTTLRRRNGTLAESENILILEKSNPNIPFVPLTPMSPPSPARNPFADPNELAMPLGRLSIGAGHHSAPSDSLPGMDPPQIRSIETPLDATTHASGSSFISPPSFVFPPTQDNVHSRGTSPFTNADVSRSGTPFTDAASNHSFADIRSGTPSFSDLAPSEASFVSYNNDVEEQMMSSFVLSTGSSGSEIGSGHSNQRIFIRSPQIVSSQLSDEDEWDRLSE